LTVDACHDEEMTQKKSKKNGYTRVTLADIAREMAKPRMAESARKAAVAAPGPKVRDEQNRPRRATMPLRLWLGN
jgi:hypothetical protein